MAASSSSSQQVPDSSMSKEAYDDGSKQPNVDDSTPKVHSKKEIHFMTKRTEFFGHHTPIVLQETNGPCSLIAICNVLLLRSEINIDSAINAHQEVSQNDLIMVIGEKLWLVSQRNIENDPADRENQEKILQKALDALPRLAIGLNVNLGLNRIDAFETNSEITVFRLLDIPIYHGWLVDPQDCNITEAFGSAWYDDIQIERVILMQQQDEELKRSRILGDADYAVPGNPSGSPTTGHEQGSGSKRDSIIEMDVENSLKLSEAAAPVPVSVFFEEPEFEDAAFDSLEQTLMPADKTDILKASNIAFNTEEPVMVVGQHEVAISSWNIDSGITDGDDDLSVADSDEYFDALLDNACVPLADSDEDTGTLIDSASAPVIEKELMDSQMDKDEQSTLAADVDSAEQTQDGKRCISGGESVRIDEDDVLAGQPYESSAAAANVELINSFLDGNRSQLTNYGISCLQEGLKERELCVLFRNDHLSTMIKYNGELYLLQTDVGYKHQPNHIWGTLSEVNGATTFVTSSFQEFQTGVNTTSRCEGNRSGKNDFNDGDWHDSNWDRQKDHSPSYKGSKDGGWGYYNSGKSDFNDGGWPSGDWDNQKDYSPSNKGSKDDGWNDHSSGNKEFSDCGWHGSSWDNKQDSPNNKDSKNDGWGDPSSSNNDVNDCSWHGGDLNNQKDHSLSNKNSQDGGWDDQNSGNKDFNDGGWGNWKDHSPSNMSANDGGWQGGSWDDWKDKGANDGSWEDSKDHGSKDVGRDNWDGRGSDDGGLDSWKDVSSDKPEDRVWDQIEEEDYQLALKLQQIEYEENLK